VAKNYYELLDVHPNASPAELKRGYEMALARANRDGATRYMMDLVKAYEVLSHPGRRKVYDTTGIGVVPERVPNTFGRPVAFRGGHLGLGVRRHSAPPGITVVPGYGASRRGGRWLPWLAVAALVLVVAGALLASVLRPS
jgi:curved DNA-binding protein CbpA